MSDQPSVKVIIIHQKSLLAVKGLKLSRISIIVYTLHRKIPVYFKNV